MKYTKSELRELARMLKNKRVNIKDSYVSMDSLKQLEEKLGCQIATIEITRTQSDFQMIEVLYATK